jgi:large subunit ribosomal protein L29
MKAAELREKGTADLRELLDEQRQTRFKLRMQHYTGQLENVSSLKETRRSIARILTILRERELAE